MSSIFTTIGAAVGYILNPQVQKTQQSQEDLEEWVHLDCLKIDTVAAASLAAPLNPQEELMQRLQNFVCRPRISRPITKSDLFPKLKPKASLQILNQSQKAQHKSMQIAAETEVFSTIQRAPSVTLRPIRGAKKAKASKKNPGSKSDSHKHFPMHRTLQQPR